MLRIVMAAVLTTTTACWEVAVDRTCTRNDDCGADSCCIFEEDESDGLCIPVSPALVISAEGLCPKACGTTPECAQGLTCFAEAERFCEGDEPQGGCVVAADQDDAVRCE